ncbi:hypothetical protein MAR_016686 [Mya arenaria]|uniref:Uncharacterized protein n=1 Tax=Mya arenaria TaxID=6604 RepID=A0ABY7EDD6_MYAAR|nr:hypothetical protein MAR_016686 [Mya arenaria]
MDPRQNNNYESITQNGAQNCAINNDHVTYPPYNGVNGHAPPCGPDAPYEDAPPPYTAVASSPEGQGQFHNIAQIGNTPNGNGAVQPPSYGVALNRYDALAFMVPVFNVVLWSRVRGKVRESKGIPGDVRGDCLRILLCPFCALMQEAQEVLPREPSDPRMRRY